MRCLPRFFPLISRALSIALLTTATLHGQQPAPRDPIVALRNGQWFDGRQFSAGTRWMQSGRFVPRPAVSTDSVIDLAGGFVVPPFGDAHTHSPDGRWGFDGIRDMYLRLGVFYVQTLANSRAGRREIAAQVNIPASIDVAFANAAVTSTGGHPQVLYESLGLFRRFWQTPAEQQQSARSLARDRDVYERLDSLPQLEAIVRRLTRDSVPVLKVMLLDSEQWEARHRDTTQAGFYGMNPSLLAPLVRAAHAAGRRVWAHVETPYDLALALRDGVDGFAHVPGYGAATATDAVAPTLVIPDSTIRLAGARRVPMTATLGLLAGNAATDTAQLRRFTDVTVRNARALRAAGVQLLAGSDTYSNADIIRNDPLATARFLDLTPLQLLQLWAVDTPRAIFPGRAIGSLAPGFEASALVLECDPIRDTTCLGRISRRLKQGQWLPAPASP
jgi:imidazolonepropionase-like amidohydrolase